MLGPVKGALHTTCGYACIHVDKCTLHRDANICVDTMITQHGRSAMPRSTLNVGLPKLLPVDWSNHILDVTTTAVTFAALTVW